MNKHQQNKTLAHEIGLCRIATVVNHFYAQTRTQPILVEPFGVAGTWGDQRARLTYFWWVALGGRPLHAVDFNLVPKHVPAHVNSDQFKGWMSLFRQVALPIIGEELTRAWMEKAERLGRRLLVIDDDYLVKLAKAS
jgi:hemoglobin